MKFKLVSPKKLKKLGILGMNARNIEYINRYNKRELYPLVDDKLKTKQLVQKYGLKAPELFGHIKYHGEIKFLTEIIPENDGFVIKPAHGSGGKGILVIIKQEDGVYIKSNGEKLKLQDLKRHISNTLSGLHSLGGRNDIVLIEHLIKFDNVFDGFSFEGVPDIRVIVYRGFPVMAMMRLSTSDSDGKANLHQGAVGVGIDIATGEAISSVQFNRTIEKHPDTDKELLTLKVPYWNEILILASRSYDMTSLGYLGADIVLDKEQGPMLLELNARPGLAIQISNSEGMVNRFKIIDKVADEKEFNTEQRVKFSIENLTLSIND